MDRRRPWAWLSAQNPTDPDRVEGRFSWRIPPPRPQSARGDLDEIRVGVTDHPSHPRQLCRERASSERISWRFPAANGGRGPFCLAPTTDLPATPPPAPRPSKESRTCQL